jgi:MFS family permease
VSEAGAQAAAAHERGVGRPARRLLLLVGPVLLIETMFFTAVAPLLPHYEETLGLSKFQAGVLVGAYGAGCFAGAIPGGVFASRVGVKPTMVVGLSLLAVLSVVFAFVTSIWLLDAARFGQGIGAALAWTGGLSWLVMEGSRERRGELIGIATAAAAAGALLGPALGGVASVVGTRPAFAAAALPTLILAIACLFVTGPTARVAQHPRSLIRAVGRPRLATGLWLMTLASLALGALDVLAPLRLGHLGMSGAAIGAIFLAAAATQIGANVFVGRHADRHGRSTTLRLVLAAAVTVGLGLTVANTDWLLGLLVVCAGTVFGAFFAPSMALVADEAELAGIELVLVLALLNIAWSPGQLIGTTGSGALAGATGDWVPYLVLAILCFGSLALLGRLTWTRPSTLGTPGAHQ